MATSAFEPLLSPVTAALAGLTLRAASIIAVRSAIILASPSSNDSAKVLPRRIGLQPPSCWRRSWRSSDERRAPFPRVLGKVQLLPRASFFWEVLGPRPPARGAVVFPQNNRRVTFQTEACAAINCLGPETIWTRSTNVLQLSAAPYARHHGRTSERLSTGCTQMSAGMHSKGARTQDHQSS